MAFPTSDMPGHKRVRERIEAALDRVVESSNVDFKASAPWAALKWKIVKTVLGMGNLRDGGLIIGGVSEGDGTWQLEGMLEADLATFDADTMAAIFEKYVSPAPVAEVVVHERDAKKYLVLDIREFEEIPFVCRSNGPEGKGLDVGGFYHRPLGGVPRTEKVRSAEDMRPILQIATEKGARRILEQGQRVGLLGTLPHQGTADNRYDEELGDL